MHYYLYDEVVIHNKKDDFWLVIHRNVLNLTPLLNDRRDHWNRNLDYLLAFGGKDLSLMFHENGVPKTEVSVSTGKPRILFPPILEVAISEFAKSKGVMWSQDPFYHIGRITDRPRPLRLINTLTRSIQHMTVCDEDTIHEIQRKYKERYNHHAGSYEWRKFADGCHLCTALNLSGTLDENGIFDESCVMMQLPAPTIWLYYTDDLTIA